MQRITRSQLLQSTMNWLDHNVQRTKHTAVNESDCPSLPAASCVSHKSVPGHELLCRHGQPAPCVLFCGDGKPTKCINVTSHPTASWGPLKSQRVKTNYVLPVRRGGMLGNQWPHMPQQQPAMTLLWTTPRCPADGPKMDHPFTFPKPSSMTSQSAHLIFPQSLCIQRPLLYNRTASWSCSLFCFLLRQPHPAHKSQ